MSPELVGVLGIVLLLLLFALRMPVGIAMLLVGFLGYCYLSSVDAALSKLGMDVFATASSYSLSVIPLFILMGMILSYAGLGAKLYRAVDVWLGHLRGGMAMATIGACAAFAAVCGSTVATVATMAKVALPEMKQYGYKDSLATACVAAGGTLGILIPPSVILVLYGVLTLEPIGKLLIASCEAQPHAGSCPCRDSSKGKDRVAERHVAGYRHILSRNGGNVFRRFHTYRGRCRGRFYSVARCICNEKPRS